MVTKAAMIALAAALILGATTRVSAAPEGAGLDAAQLVEVAVEVNPQVKAARAQWQAAVHSIKQNYAPADPIFDYQNIDSPTNGLNQASEHSIQISDAFQFPGKALLQADQARKAAQVARLVYEATIRDIRAQTEAAYYQALLDGALGEVQGTTVQNLRQVLNVTQVAYSANQVTQTDFISAEYDLAAARQQQEQLRTAEANDGTTINQLLYRRPDEPLKLDRKFELQPLTAPLDHLIDLAIALRQEILEAALTQTNSETALRLARLEYAPDYTLGFVFDNYLLSSAAPSPQRLQDWGFTIGINLPVFFWLKQNEDVKRAGYNLEAAREDLNSIKNQTAAIVTTLYRNALLAYQTALLYRDSLIPLAQQNFQVALIAYESGRIDFVTLASAIRRGYDSRAAYLQAANQYIAARVALEQAIGEPLEK
ncbi:MAG TPA: TolC family protein [Candidatus Binataceae bacterium]